MGRFQPITREPQQEKRHATEKDQKMLAILKEETEIIGISGQSNISIQHALEEGTSLKNLHDDLHFQVSQIMINNYDTMITTSEGYKSLNLIERIFLLNIDPVIKLLILDNQIEIQNSKIELKNPNKSLLDKTRISLGENQDEDEVKFNETYSKLLQETQELIDKLPRRLIFEIQECIQKNKLIKDSIFLENFRNLILYEEGIFETEERYQKYKSLSTYFNRLEHQNIIYEKPENKIVKETNIYRNFVLDFEFKIRNYSTSPRAILAELVFQYFGLKLKNYTKLYVILSDITNSTHNFVLENIFGRSQFDCEKAWEFNKQEDLIQHYHNSLIFLISTCQASLMEKEDIKNIQDLYTALQISLPKDTKKILPDIISLEPLEFDFSFLPTDLNEAANYLMQILREAKPPSNEVQWRYLNMVRFLIEGIFFDITNEGHNNPLELEKINANIIAKFKEDPHFHHLGRAEDENTDYFYTKIIDEPALLKVAAPKSSTSQMRKRAAKETSPDQIQDCHRATLLLSGRATDYTRDQILNIAYQFLSYVANQFGDTTYGESKITISEYHDCIDTEMSGGANQFSIIQFIKVILNAKNRELGLVQRPFEIQIRFADDEIQSHSQYNVKQLKKISRKFLPTYKEGVLNSIHHLSLNNPGNIVNSEEKEAFIWHLGFVINAIFNNEVEEFKETDEASLSQQTIQTLSTHFVPQKGIEIVSGFIDKDLAYSSNKMPTRNTQTVREALKTILEELAETTLDACDREKLKSYITIPNFNMDEFHKLPSLIDCVYPNSISLNHS